MTPRRLLCVTVVALAIGAVIVYSSVVGAQPNITSIVARDACDPDSFNAAAGPGTCVNLPGNPHGTIPFALFIQELQQDRIAGAWRFNPMLDASAGTFKLVTLNLAAGQQTLIQNKGGETHTFTRVKEFGGGVVPPLNALSGNPIPAPECLQPASETNITVGSGASQPGPTAGSSALPEETSKWQCCIHPWMRLRIAVNQGQQGQQ